MSPHKRFKRDATTLQCLPNELFLEVFSYLTHVDTVYTFIQLNERFRSLTLNFCQNFDFQSVRKNQFDHIIRNHDVHRWKSLRLSNNERTPGQLAYFCRHLSWSKHFSQLEHLSFVELKPIHVHLYLSSINVLSNLISLSLTGFICANALFKFDLPSLKSLRIHSCLSCRWMQNLPNLKNLRHTLEHSCQHEQVLSWPKSLEQLTVSYTNAEANNAVRAALSHLPKLTHLSIYDNAWDSPPPNGLIWETLISCSLPHLRDFRFCFQFWRDSSLVCDPHRIIDTFSSPFYLKEKSWFVQCDAYDDYFSCALLYSLPYPFERFHLVSNSYQKSISTLPSSHPTTTKLHSKVRMLTVDVACEQIDQSFPSDRIVDLTMKYCGKIPECLLPLNHLRQLTFPSGLNMSSRNFLCLLQNTPSLDSLATPLQTLRHLTNFWTDQKVSCHLSHKIRSLKISSDRIFSCPQNNYVKVEELIPIVRIFHHRCEHLTIAVYSRNLVVGFLLRKMAQLRSLKVRLQEHADMKITKKWLEEQDSSFKQLNYSLVMEDDEYSFWFAHRRVSQLQ